MAYLHWRIRTSIPIRIVNQMATFYYISHCTESDSNPNCQLQEWDQNRNPYLWMWINHNELFYSLGGQINGEEFVS